MPNPPLASGPLDVIPGHAHELVARYWQRHQQWSTLADQLKRQVTRWRTATLVLAATGAVLQTTSAALGSGALGTVVAVVGAVALVLVLFIAKFFLGPENVRQWLRSRSMSESLKSLVYRFEAGGAPFDGDDRVVRLAAAARQLEGWGPSLVVEFASIETAFAPAPGALAPDAYLARRVRDQIENYYRPRARANSRLAQRFRRLELIAAAIAAILGAVATGLKLGPHTAGASGIGAWVAVITTIGGSVAAHAAASRYDHQARMFFATARQLEDMLDDWTALSGPRDPAHWSAFVGACEDVISVENRGWLAKLDLEEQRTTAPP